MTMRLPADPTVVRTPAALSGATGDRFVDLLAQGHSIPKAAELTKVSLVTVRWWLLRGGYANSKSYNLCPPDVRVEPYWSFAQRVEAAVKVGKKVDLPGPPRGRKPAYITDNQKRQIYQALLAGEPWNRACRAAGVKLSTFTSWLRLGGYPRRVSVFRPVAEGYVREPYRTFVKTVLAAEEEASRGA